MTSSLERLFSPRSVAVIGASNRELSIGHRVLKNILDNGFTGTVYPVNPRENEILGLKVYPSVEEIPGEVDLVNISIKNTMVPAVMEQCGRKGVKFAIIHSGGFREVGGEGARLEDEVMEIASKYSVRVYGPNSQGVMNSDPAVSLYANFTFTPMTKGVVSILAQSGGVAEVLNLNLRERGLGFRLYASNGNARDVSIAEILHHYGNDPLTKVILLQVENFKDPDEFIRIVSPITAHKPILALKSGKTKEGSAAVASHTGALMEDDTLTDAIFEKCGVLRLDSMEEMVEAALAFATQPCPAGPRVGIMSNAGGPGIIAVDECVQLGLSLPGLTEPSREALKGGLPPEGHCDNPVDTAATAGPAAFATATATLLADPNVDSVMVNMVTPFFVDSQGNAQAIVDEWLRSGKEKPIVCVLMTNENWISTLETLKGAGIPTYSFPETAARVLKRMADWSRVRARSVESLERVERDLALAREVVEEHVRDGGGFMPARRAFRFLEAFRIPAVPSRSVREEGELAGVVGALGFPLVLKVEAKEVVHRSDVGGVLLGIDSSQRLLEGFRMLKEKFSRYNPWVTVQKQLSPGREVIVGASRERGLTLIMVGTGGIYVELLKDVVFKLAPLSRPAIEEMLRSLKGWPLLAGVRGGKRADIAPLTEIVCRVQQAMEEVPELAELELNPVIVYDEGEGAFVVDARIRV